MGVYSASNVRPCSPYFLRHILGIRNREVIAGPPAAGRAFKNMRAGCVYGLATTAYLSSLWYPRVCGRPKSQGFRCQDWTFSGQQRRWGVSRASSLSFASVAIVQSLANTLHSIALHLEHSDLSAFPVHLRVLATFSYSALIMQTSSPTSTFMRRRT